MADRVIAGYEIVGKLGEGGMGVVYHARDATLGRRVALKVIPSQTISPEGKERFLRESRACSVINHPNIVTVYSAGEDEQGRPFLAMEYLEGETIRDVIDRGPMPWQQAIEWSIDLLDALGRLHQEDIVHRDLKPENIFVTTEGRVKLMDFGIARVGSAKTLTQIGTSLGTAHYMSPEQAVAEQRVDHRSDLFSFATVLYEMLAASLPFPGEHEMAVLYSIVNSDPIPLSDHEIEIPAELEAVIYKALEKDLDDRYKTAGEFQEALKALVKDKESSATSPKKLIIAIGAVGVLVAAAMIVSPIIQGKMAEKKRDKSKQLNELATEHERQGNIGQAKIHYREATLADPTFALPWNNLGDIAQRDGDLAEADSLFRMAIRADSNYTKALDALASVRWDREDLASAEIYFEASIRSDSTYARGYNNLAALLIHQERPQEALAIIWLGLSYQLDNPILLKKLGEAQAAVGEEENAIESWKTAIDQANKIAADKTLAKAAGAEPRELRVIAAASHALLATTYEARGDRGMAVEHWMEAAKSEVFRAEAEDALSRLRSQ